MELPSRPKTDRYTPPGRYNELEYRLRKNPATSGLSALVCYAFDYRTRLGPFLFADMSLLTAGPRAVAACLHEAGISTAIMSGRIHPAVARRARDLGIQHVMQAVADKDKALDELLQATGKNAEQCGFMGDDWIDIAIMQRVGFAASVPNAADTVPQYAHWISRRNGGLGAVREVCDLILSAHSMAQAGKAERHA